MSTAGLYRIRNILRAGAAHLTDKHWDRLIDCLGRGDPDSEVLLAWHCYQQVRSAYDNLRGSALGFRNLTHYIARSLLETGGFRPRLHPGL